MGGGPNACIRFCGNFVFNCYFCKRNYIKAASALNFADENGYVPLTEMLDKESVEYGINIIDHAAAPMQQSIVTVRQLMQALQKMQNAFYTSMNRK